jgi:hypothetical protein
MGIPKRGESVCHLITHRFCSRLEPGSSIQLQVENVKKKKGYDSKKLAHAGLEPATFALLARRSNQLS